MSGAIFTPDEVANLARYQTGEGRGPFERMHPFTCSNRGDGAHRDIYGDLGALVPTVRGWICPFCDYTQKWAHGFMASNPIPTDLMDAGEVPAGIDHSGEIYD
jgi:hypothetical protein